MNKKILIPLFILIIFIILFIPVSQQNTVSIKASFFNVYQRLSKGNYWIEWNKELNKTSATVYNVHTDGFEISNKNINYTVQIHGNNFSISKKHQNNITYYNYFIIPHNLIDSTSIISIRKITLIDYILGIIGIKPDKTNNIDDFKLYMETPSLYYGFNIIKRKVTDTNILVLKKLVLTKNKFFEAKKSFEILKQYLVKNNLKQTQPLMAQFLTKANDSTEVNIGIPIDKAVISTTEIHFLRMPKTGSLYTLNFRGKFKDRIKAYSSVRNYFDDKHLAMPILPFEIYLDNKLPASENDIINIELKCSTF